MQKSLHFSDKYVKTQALATKRLIFMLFCAIGCHEIYSFIQRNYVQLMVIMN